MTIFWWGGLFLLMPLVSTQAYAASQRRAVAEGNRLYKEGDFERSIQKYEDALQKNPESDIIHFNMGTALYKRNDYEGSIQHLEKSLLSEDERLKGNAHYNLGNAFYMAGRDKENSDISSAISSLKKALEHYKGALAADKNDADAQYNYDFVKKELERLLEKQKQSQQDQQRQDSSEEKNKQEGPEESGPQDKAKEQEKGQDNQQDKKAEDQQQQGQKEPQEDASAQDRMEEQSTKSDEQGRHQPQDGSREGQTPETGNAQELTPQEAGRLLESYQQTEEPQGLLNVFQGRGDMAPVLKDW